MISGEEPEERKAESLSLPQRIGRMTVAEKIKLAFIGDKEARGLLVREGNKLIQMAVARNPRLTDLEVIQIAKMKSLDQSVLRYLATDRKWQKIYRLKVELVKNPKTPRPLALKLLSLLHDSDLRQIAKGADVIKDVSLQATRLLSLKK